MTALRLGWKETSAEVDHNRSVMERVQDKFLSSEAISCFVLKGAGWSTREIAHYLGSTEDDVRRVCRQITTLLGQEHSAVLKEIGSPIGYKGKRPMNPIQGEAVRTRGQNPRKQMRRAKITSVMGDQLAM